MGCPARLPAWPDNAIAVEGDGGRVETEGWFTVLPPSFSLSPSSLQTENIAVIHQKIY